MTVICTIRKSNYRLFICKFKSHLVPQLLVLLLAIKEVTEKQVI